MEIISIKRKTFRSHSVRSPQCEFVANCRECRGLWLDVLDAHDASVLVSDGKDVVRPLDSHPAHRLVWEDPWVFQKKLKEAGLLCLLKKWVKEESYQENVAVGISVERICLKWRRSKKEKWIIQLTTTAALTDWRFGVLCRTCRGVRL